MSRCTLEGKTVKNSLVGNLLYLNFLKRRGILTMYSYADLDRAKKTYGASRERKSREKKL